MVRVIVLFAVLEFLLLPHAIGPVWILGQAAIAAGLLAGFLMHRNSGDQSSSQSHPQGPTKVVAMHNVRPPRGKAA